MLKLQNCSFVVLVVSFIVIYLNKLFYKLKETVNVNDNKNKLSFRLSKGSRKCWKQCIGFCDEYHLCGMMIKRGNLQSSFLVSIQSTVFLFLRRFLFSFVFMKYSSKNHREIFCNFDYDAVAETIIITSNKVEVNCSHPSLKFSR